MKKLLGAALLCSALTGCAGLNSDFDCNKTASDQCLTTGEANKLAAQGIRDALSPELERVIQENERAAAAAGLTFPTGEEVLAHVASAGTPASSPVEKKTATPETAPKLPQGTVPERKQVAVMEPVISGSATVVPEEGGGKHNTVTPPVIAEKKDNVVSLRSVGAMKKLTEAPGKLPVSPGVTCHPGTADSVQTMPDALKALL